MVRLFIPPERLAGSDALVLESEEAGYLLRVRRLAAGDSLEVFDGQGGRYAARVLAGARLALGERQASVEEVRFSYELWVGLAKADKLEWVIQKATELGVAKVVPMRSATAVVKLGGERAEAKLGRWRKVAQEAARQCGRAEVPAIEEIHAFTDFLRLPKGGLAPVASLLIYEREGERGLFAALRQLPDGTRVALAIGPEGGFAPVEVEAALSAGVALAGLGERILRAETAALAACALARLASGGLGDAVSQR